MAEIKLTMTRSHDKRSHGEPCTMCNIVNQKSCMDCIMIEFFKSPNQCLNIKASYLPECTYIYVIYKLSGLDFSRKKIKSVLSFCSDSKKYISWDFSKIPFLETNLGKTQLSLSLRIILMIVRGQPGNPANFRDKNIVC